MDFGGNGLDWDAMRQRWASVGHVPAEIRLAAVQLRSAVAEVAPAGSRNASNRIAAQKCLFSLGRILLHRSARQRGGKRAQKGTTYAAAIASRVRLAQLWSGSARRVAQQQNEGEAPRSRRANNTGRFCRRRSKSAARIVDERVPPAPGSKAVRSLLHLFPAAPN